MRRKLLKATGPSSQRMQDRSVLTIKRHKGIVVVCLNVLFEGVSIRLHVNDRLAAPLNRAVHASADGKRHAQLTDAGRDIEAFRAAAVRARIQSDRARRTHHDDRPERVLRQRKVRRLADRVGSIRLRRVGPRPHVELVLGDGRICAGLEGRGIVGGHVKPAGVVQTIDPSLRVGLRAFDGAEVMRFAIIVPSDDLSKGNVISLVHDVLPTGRIEVRVGKVYKLCIFCLVNQSIPA
jgi:hypothetical protein